MPHGRGHLTRVHTVRRGRSHYDLEAQAALSGCVLVSSYVDASGRIVGVWDCPDADDGAPMATAILLEGLTRSDRAARQVPRLRGSPAELHAFIRRRVRFVPDMHEGQEVETFRSPLTTLELGYGDCDDSARALVAVARARGIPARLVYFLQDGQPAHVCAQLFDRGAWRWAETTVNARYGEHPFAAMKRLGLRRSDMNGTPYVLGESGRARPLPSAPHKRTMGAMGALPANLGADFPSTLASLSSSLGADPLDILKLLLSESSLSPSARNATGFPSGQYAVGINQFAPVNWHYFSPLTAAGYAALTAEQQLPYVFAFWGDLARAHGASSPSGRDLYWLNFLPATFVANAPDDHVIVASSSGFYAPNKGLDHGAKGYITAGDLQTSLDAQMSSSLYQALAPLVGDAPSSLDFSNALLFLAAAGIGAALARTGALDSLLRSI